ncbi:MAG: radical SAM protein [Anaerolineae bacterium]|nr:radical SAM protein [Anaerolineae bacterium]
MRPPKSAMYRLPWSLNDNPIGWLEVTDKCNIYCRGCYRLNRYGHKTLDEIKNEIDYLQNWRNCDNISIAGGEPLIHPNILEIIRYIHDKGMKPLVLTNGVKLWDNKPFLQELKKAGVFGFTFHIDSEQNRPHWKGKTEEDLFALRLEYAKMVAEVGGMHVSFGSTIYPSNLDMVPRIVRWANQHIDLIHGLVFICFRGAPQDGKFNYTVEGKPVKVEVGYTAEDDHELHVTSADIYEKIKEANPNYEAVAYLGGTQTHDAVKWMLGVQFGVKGRMYGSLGVRGMEVVQTAYHMLRGSYLAYTKGNKLTKAALLLGPLDKKGIGKAHGNYWRDILRNPTRAFQQFYTQSIGVIQAPDILDDGRQDMCDSCPDMTFWNGKLVHSCRLDEWRLYGNYLQAQPVTQDIVPVSEIALAEGEQLPVEAK